MTHLKSASTCGQYVSGNAFALLVTTTSLSLVPFRLYQSLEGFLKCEKHRVNFSGVRALWRVKYFQCDHRCLKLNIEYRKYDIWIFIYELQDFTLCARDILMWFGILIKSHFLLLVLGQAFINWELQCEKPCKIVYKIRGGSRINLNRQTKQVLWPPILLMSKQT